LTDTTAESGRRPRKPSVRKITDLTPYQQDVRHVATIVAREPSDKNLAMLADAAKTMQAAFRSQFGVGEMPPRFGSEPAAAAPEAEVAENVASEQGPEYAERAGRRGRAAA
jgi:hypothetical protein